MVKKKAAVRDFLDAAQELHLVVAKCNELALAIASREKSEADLEALKVLDEVVKFTLHRMELITQWSKET